MIRPVRTQRGRTVSGAKELRKLTQSGPDAVRQASHVEEKCVGIRGLPRIRRRFTAAGIVLRILIEGLVVGGNRQRQQAGRRAAVPTAHIRARYVVALRSDIGGGESWDF